MASAVRRPVVLIVEDEPLLRISGAEMVAEAGFDVVEAGNADEAIAILEARPDIHIVFTDIQMPGSMDGLKLARFVSDRWPPIKLVVTSGRVAISEGDLPKGGLFIGKPYTAPRIAEVLRKPRRAHVTTGNLDGPTKPSRLRSTWALPRLAQAFFNLRFEEWFSTGSKFFADPLKPKPVLLIHLAPPRRWLPGRPLGPRD